jgi:16S rRNA (guanine966-N2)-methyltransferase
LNSVRIIGGQYRRRVLKFPESEGLRPTPDRVRETLFNWLGQALDGWHCLDLFAGSGALGFEAASRGATKVVMVEQAPKVIAALRDNAELIGAQPTVEIKRLDAIQYLSSTQTKFDLILLDPPFHKGWLDRLAPHLAPVAQAGAVLYVEAEKQLDGLGPWQTYRHGRAGEVYFHLMQREQLET